MGNNIDWRLKQIVEDIITEADVRLEENSAESVRGEIIGLAEALTII